MPINNYFSIIWIAAASCFVLFFIYALSKSRNLKLRANYGVWISVFALFFVGILSGIMQFKNIQTRTQADAQITPKELRINQTGENEAVLTWTTDKAVFQSVKYKKADGEWKFAFDDKMTLAVTNHHMTIKDLQKGIKYQFVIISGKNEYATYQNQEISIILK